MAVSNTRKIRINHEFCVGCGLCLEICPQGAISIQSGLAVIDQARCKGCGICIDACPRGAITESVPVSRTELAATVAELRKQADDILNRIERMTH